MEKGDRAEETDEESRAVEGLQKAYDDLNDRFLRLAADFDNYQKRIAREIDDCRTYAIESFAVELLDVLDNLERAARAEDGSLREGLEHIRKLFATILERHGIRPLECLNRPFDPREHEAVAYVPSDTDEGMVIEELIRGYCMHDRIIRCARVVVSRGKEE
ncbi:MAG: nucleotide exchange factor GrpE [Methanomicrobiaceae archaeon]|nr:nucleotide exchange factor GrpE [Methanomicrobiaceae archaeon]